MNRFGVTEKDMEYARQRDHMLASGFVQVRHYVRLSELARRRGWLHLTDDTLLVRFPLEAADLRLRRLALDADPGWVPWLGLAVRYHYRDTPLA